MALLLLAGTTVVWTARAQERQEKKPPTPGPMLEQGYIDLETPAFSVRLVRSSQTIAALKPKGAGEFDFTPGDLLVERSKDGYYHLGDIDLRLRTGNSGEWKSYSTALARTPVTVLPTQAQILAAADLSADAASRHSRTNCTDVGTSRKQSGFAVHAEEQDSSSPCRLGRWASR